MQKWLIPILGVKYERKLCRIVDIYIVTLFAYAIINKMLLREHDIQSFSLYTYYTQCIECVYKNESQNMLDPCVYCIYEHFDKGVL